MPLGKFFGWLHGKRQPLALPDVLWQETLAALPFLDRLTRHDKERLRQLAACFLAEKEFAGAGGLALTDAMCVSIAAQACLPILELGLENYHDWIGIVVYPDEFIIPRAIEDEYGLVHEFDDVASGEAWSGGPVLISWRDAQMAGDGYNVVIHEFAHKLDMRNGEADGIPPLPAGLTRAEWEAVFFVAYDDFCARVETADEKGDAGLAELPLDPYAAEHPAEFFAVMSESFFEAPDVLYDEYPDLYGLFCRFYRQEPRRVRH